MKTRFFRGLQFGKVVGGGSLLACLMAATVANAQDDSGIPTSSSPPVSVASLQDTGGVEIPSTFSPGIAELAKLAQSNVSLDVILAFIANSNFAFNPTADEILYLTDLGMSNSVITAMIERGKVVRSLEKPPTLTATTNVTSVTNIISAPAPVVSAPATVVVSETAPPTQVVQVNQFYDSLAPYGSWVQVDDYGMCWQPTAVVLDVNWRPYRDRGSWVYTDCGWYWRSDYSWGWAPFHYGRWQVSSRYGWVWIPDTTWGASWVSWRYASSGYCGWAPLPPAARYEVGVGFRYGSTRVGIGFDFGLREDCYTFVPTRNFCDRSVYRFSLSVAQTRVVYRGSSVINNYGHHNNRFVNEGFGRERIVAVTHKEIKPVTIRDKHTSSTPQGRHESFDRKSGSMTVYRPQPQRSSGPGSNSDGRRDGKPSDNHYNFVPRSVVDNRSAPAANNSNRQPFPERNALSGTIGTSRNGYVAPPRSTTPSTGNAAPVVSTPSSNPGVVAGSQDRRTWDANRRSGTTGGTESRSDFGRRSSSNSTGSTGNSAPVVSSPTPTPGAVTGSQERRTWDSSRRSGTTGGTDARPDFRRDRSSNPTTSTPNGSAATTTTPTTRSENRSGQSSYSPQFNRSQGVGQLNGGNSGSVPATPTLRTRPAPESRPATLPQVNSRPSQSPSPSTSGAAGQSSGRSFSRGSSEGRSSRSDDAKR